MVQFTRPYSAPTFPPARHCTALPAGCYRLFRQPAFEALSRLRIAAQIVRVLRIGTKWPRTARDGVTCAQHPIRCDTLLDPANDGRKQVELIEHRLASATVPHTRHQEETAEAAHRISTTVGLRQALVVKPGIIGRKPGVTHSMIKQ